MSTYRWLVLSALGLCACAPRSDGPAAATPAADVGHVASLGRRVEVVSLRGHIRLDPRAQYQHDEGDVWQHVFYLGGELFDGLLCYPHADRCTVVDIQRDGSSASWSATLSEALPNTTPVILHFDVPPDGDWRRASQVRLRVVAPGVGDVGATTLEPDTAASSSAEVRERLRGEQRLRRVYESLALTYRLANAAERQLPASHPERPSPPPCGPMWVRDQETVEWLGLSAPVVLSWAFSLESDPRAGTLRLIARRDRNCRGDIESLVLTAHVDEYGDLERGGIERR